MKKIVSILLLTLVATAGMAQKIKVFEGDLKAIKGQTKIKTEFTYDNMTIGGKGLSEADYVAKKKAEYDEKEPGRGDKFATAWVADREARFEPKFKELFTKTSGMEIADDAQYTIIFKTTRTEPGFNVGVMRQSAQIDAEAWFVETANPSNVIAKVSIIKAPGQDAFGYDFDSGLRIQEAYAKSGKELGKLVKK